MPGVRTMTSPSWPAGSSWPWLPWIRISTPQYGLPAAPMRRPSGVKRLPTIEGLASGMPEPSEISTPNFSSKRWCTCSDKACPPDTQARSADRSTPSGIGVSRRFQYMVGTPIKTLTPSPPPRPPGLGALGARAVNLGSPHDAGTDMEKGGKHAGMAKHMGKWQRTIATILRRQFEQIVRKRLYVPQDVEMRQLHAFGPPGRSRGVQNHCGLSRLKLGKRVGQCARHDRQSCRFDTDIDDGATRIEFRQCLTQFAGMAAIIKNQCRIAVARNRRDFGRDQQRVDRHGDGPALQHAVVHDCPGNRVGQHDHHAFKRLHDQDAQGIGTTCGHSIQLAIAYPARTFDQRDGVRSLARLPAHRFRNIQAHGHTFLISMSLVSRHRSDVVGCAQPSERSARRIACQYRAYWQAMQRRDALRWPTQTDR